MFRTKRGEINMIVEVGPVTRKKLLRSKLKMGWLICRAGDYLVAKRCYKCSRYNGMADMQGGRLPGGEKMLQV
jgi:hypothetical protein